MEGRVTQYLRVISPEGQRLLLKGGIYLLAFLVLCLYGGVEEFKAREAQGQKKADAGSWLSGPGCVSGGDLP